MFKKLFGLCLFVSSAFAVEESQLHIVYQLLNEKKLFSIGSFSGQNDLTLKYLKFGKRKGSKGSLIFVNGMGENVIMYLELFYDLHLQGWSPIYTYDHRGQGLSDRILSDPHVGYVEDWSFYKKDLNTFIQLVLRDSQVDRQNLFLMANSMGSAITVEYFQNFPNQQNVFNAVVLASPFFGLHARGFDFAEPVFPYFIRFVCLFRDCLSPIVGPNSRQLSREVVQGRMTSSADRYDLFTRSAKMYSAGHIVPSLDWVIKAFWMNRRVMNRENILKLTLPILILQADRDSVVSNRRQKKFCGKIENCSLKVTKGRHDHFIEADEIRNQAILETVQFFQKYYQ
ncbi:MAG: alpha/beta fold hydrolase [Bdellovibrionales bacterium]|nr:alpha/beta fold hydrolase [Bdellovibrionales bacterium]